MSMTLLQIVEEFCGRTGLDVPTAVMGSQDKGVLQMKGLLNELITDIVSRGESWPRLQKQGHWTSVAAELQTTIAAAAPYGFKYLIEDSIWDRTERRPLFGPRNAPAWQESEALPYTGPMYTYRFWEGNIYVQPAMPVAHECYFEYASDFAILGSVSATDYKKRFTKDDDVFLLNEDLLLAGLRWKWKAEKGLRFATEKQDWEALLAQEMGNDSAKPALNMAEPNMGRVKPGIFVPLGNWNIP
jgi:hypothetical protein